jgi:hypothetical protein
MKLCMEVSTKNVVIRFPLHPAMDMAMVEAAALEAALP